jgi:hypothetical protein
MKKTDHLFQRPYLWKILTIVFALGLSSYSTHAQIRFSEISGDSGNNDGTNDGIVELINTGGTDFDAGCYVISNSEWIVVLPPGTTIPAGEVFLIACSAGQNTGTNPNPVEGSGLTCTTCDFPNMPIDFDVCDPANANYVDWAATGFTIDNQAADDGDQIVLFEPNGTPVQGVQWGGGATNTGADNTAVQGGTYTLGTGTGLTSAQLPVSLQPGGDCYQMGVNYTMPIITDNLYEDLTNTPNPGGKALNNAVLQGCNSSFMYNPATDSWSKTDSPNPGLPNDALAYDVQFSAPLVQCENSTQPVTVTLEVYNWQAVTQGTTNAKGGVGSFVSFDGGATQTAWTTFNRNDANGVTTLTYTFTPTMNETLTIVWNDDNSSPFASTPNGSSSPTAVVNNTTPSDCYTVEQFQVVVAPVMMASQTDVACPADFTVGTVNISSLVTGGDNVTYELFNNGVSQGSNGTGIFNIPDGFTGPITVVVTDGSGCTPPITIDIDNNCRQMPPCPELTASMDDDADDVLCPGDQVCFDITTFNNLPEGGTIDYYFDTDPNFNPYAGDGTLLGSADINSTGVSCPGGGANVFISELSDPASGWQCDRYIEIYNGGPCPQDLTGWTLRAIGNNSDAVVFNLSGTINPGQAMIASASRAGGMPCAGDATLSPDFTFNDDWNGGAPGNFNGQSRDGAILEDDMGNIIDVAVINTNDDNNWFENDLTVRNADICSGLVPAGMAETICGNSMSCMDLTDNWNLATGGSPTPGTHTVTMGTCPTGGGSTTVDQFCYTFDDSFCNLTMNGEFYVKAVVNPFDAFTGCSETDADRFESFTFNMSCPTATLTGGGTACAPNSVPLEIDFDNYTGTPTFTINYTVDGLAQPQIMTTDDPYQLNASASGEYILTGVSVDGGNCEATASGAAIVQINDAPVVTLSGTVNDVCIDAFANVPLTISQGTLPMMITYDIDNGTPETVEIFSNQLNIPTTGLAADNSYTVNITAVADANGCTGTASGSATINTINCNFTCPTITALNAPDDACANGNFDLEATGLADMAMANNGEADFGIEFIYFAGMTPPADPYADGTSLGTVVSNNLTGTSPNQSALLENVSITTAGTYQVCAILNAVPATDATCRPTVCQTVRIAETPVLTATPTMQELCANDIVSMDGADLSTTDVQFTLEAMPNITLETSEQLRYRVRNQGLGMMPSMIDNPNAGITITGMPVADPNGFTVILNPSDDQQVLIEDNIQITGDLSNFTQPITIQYAIFPRHRFADGTFCDGDDIVVTTTIAPPILIEAGEQRTICSTKKLPLADLNPSITQGGQSFTGTWSIEENDSNGMFLDANMQPLGTTGRFDANDANAAAYFMPGAEDAERGSVTLILTSDASASCNSVRDEVMVMVLKVDCGHFPWDGSKH